MERITEHSLKEFRQWLICEERQEGTIQKYLRDVNELMTYLNGEEITKEKVSEWKEYLLNEKRLFPVTINSKLAAVGTYCRFAGIDCRVRFYKIQRKLFYEENKNLQKDEYLRFDGSPEDWIASLIGKNEGKKAVSASPLFITASAAKVTTNCCDSAYVQSVAKGLKLTLQKFFRNLLGLENGASAYEVAVANGYTGTEVV